MPQTAKEQTGYKISWLPLSPRICPPATKAHRKLRSEQPSAAHTQALPTHKTAATSPGAQDSCPSAAMRNTERSWQAERNIKM